MATGNTLSLKVRHDGNGGRDSAQWLQIIRMEGKRAERGLGGYPLVTLDEARQVAFESRRAARRGENPWTDKDAAKMVPTAPTFEDALRNKRFGVGMPCPTTRASTATGRDIGRVLRNRACGSRRMGC